LALYLYAVPCRTANSGSLISLNEGSNKSATMDVKTATNSPTVAEAPPLPEKVEESDGSIHIDPELERKVLKKFDMLVMPQFIIIILLAYLDRSNIGLCPMIRAKADSTDRSIRQCTCVRLRGRPWPCRQPIRQCFKLFLRHICHLRSSVGSGCEALRREFGGSYCYRSLVCDHDWYWLRQELWTDYSYAVAPRLRRSRDISCIGVCH
jgi:hypothetical protein